MSLVRTRQHVDINKLFTTDIEFSHFVQFSAYLLVLSVKHYVTEKLIFYSVLVLKGSCKLVFLKLDYY